MISDEINLSLKKLISSSSYYIKEYCNIYFYGKCFNKFLLCGDHFKYQDKFIPSQKTICGHLKRFIYKHCYRQFDSRGSTIYDQDISFKGHEFFYKVTAR